MNTLFPGERDLKWMGMKTIVNTIPGYRVNEYLLVMTPHDELAKKIGKVREEFAETYKTEHSKWGRPQIALAGFTQYAMKEERILGKLRTIAMGFPPFKVELKDFGSFPSHTIYINVISKIPVQQLVKELRRETQALMKLNDDHKPHFMMEPYISVGRKLKPWQYEKGWLDYSQRHFTGRFIAGGMQLLKRQVGDLKYQLVERFEFQNLPVTTRQGELFAVEGKPGSRENR
jgi:2'-5' RNA ligase